MTALKALQEIAQELFNRQLQVYKNGGGKIVGIFCSYIPEELIMAAGMVPFRMRAVGSTKTTAGDAWFSSVNCSYVRHLFDLALEGRFKFLDGLVFMNSCDHVRRMFDNWKVALDHPSFIHFLSVPHKRDNGAVSWYKDELLIMKQAIEKHFEVDITDHALRNAIQVTNKIRGLLSNLYDMRKGEKPPITGAETLAVIMAGTALPPEQFIDYLGRLLKELPGREVCPPDMQRIMIASGCLEEIDHIKLIEDHGGMVVDDLICFGRRWFDMEVDETVEDPLQALAERYMNHVSCPRISDDFKRRLEHIRQSAMDYRLDGLICEKLKFCDLWGGEAFILQRESKDYRLPPLLSLERELYGRGEGQIKTRVQAFLERIRRI